MGAKEEENEAKQADIMEQVYLLESQMLDGGHRSDKARERLDDMKSKRNRRKQERMSSGSGSGRSGDRKWKTRYREAQNEIEDLMSEFERQRTDLLQDIRMQHREMALYRTIVYKLMASSTVDEILYQSQWDSQREKWILPKFLDNLAMNRNAMASPTKRNMDKFNNQRHSNLNAPTSVQSVQQHIEAMNWSNKAGFSGEDGSGGLVAAQDIEDFDLEDIRNLSNHNEFEDLEMKNQEEICSKQIDVDDNFLQQISAIQEDHGFQPRMESMNETLPDKEIEVEDDFISQLSTIHDAQTFKTEIAESTEMNVLDMVDREFLVEKDRDDGSIMDIAHLMVQDKPDLVERETFDAAEFVSPEKTNIAEFDDDVLAQMMGGIGGDDYRTGEMLPNRNIFEEHRGGLMEKQDIDAADFFGDESTNEECSVDITQLHGILNRKK